MPPVLAVVVLFRVHQLGLLLWIWAYPPMVFREGEERELQSLHVAALAPLSLYRDIMAH